MNKVINCIIIFLTVLITKVSPAQTFDELHQLSEETPSMLHEILDSQGDFIIEKRILDLDTIISLSIWDKIFLSQKKEEVKGVQNSKAISPQIFAGEVSSKLWVLLVRSYEPGFISETNDIYLLNAEKQTITKLMVSGYIAKVFKKEGLLFIDHQVDEYMNPTYTQMYSIISFKGNTIISTTHQREVPTEVMK